MESALQERTARVLDQIGPVSQHVPAEAADELRRLVMLAVRAATEQERAALHSTLRLCVVAFSEALALANAPGHFRAVVRVCRTLCLDALGEGDTQETDEDDSPALDEPITLAKR